MFPPASTPSVSRRPAIHSRHTSRVPGSSLSSTYVTNDLPSSPTPLNHAERPSAATPIAVIVEAWKLPAVLLWYCSSPLTVWPSEWTLKPPRPFADDFSPPPVTEPGVLDVATVTVAVACAGRYSRSPANRSVSVYVPGASG